MSFSLTFALGRDYSVCAGANHQSGLASRETRRTAASERFFCVRHTAYPVYGWLVWGAFVLAGPSSGTPTCTSPPTRLASGEAENLNRLTRSHTNA